MSSSQRLSQVTSHLSPTTSPYGPGQLLKDQVVIITGAAQGIGRSIAVLFASHGALLSLSDLDLNKLKEVRAEVVKNGGNEDQVLLIGGKEEGNVMKEDFGERVVKATVGKWGKINHIVNNAGFTNDKMLHNTSDPLFEQMLTVHVVAPFRLIRAAAPYLRLKDPNLVKTQPRSIVNISSTSGTHGNVGQANYSAAKSAILGFSKSIAKEWGPFGVRSNVVAFGWIDTRLTRAKESGESIEIDGVKVALGIPGRPAGPAKSEEEAKKAVNAAGDIPLGRPGTTEEAASAVLFMTSGLAGYVTGQVLEVTGGRYM